MKKNILYILILSVVIMPGCNYTFKCDVYDSSSDSYVGESIVMHVEDEKEAEDACEDDAGPGYYCTDCKEE